MHARHGSRHSESSPQPSGLHGSPRVVNYSRSTVHTGRMSLRLPVVLSEHDLPLPELLAARLDGEVFRIDDAFAPLDEIEGPAHRARAILARAPSRFIAEQHSAAWVWGALQLPPVKHEYCVDIGARVSGSPARRHRVREVVIDANDIATLGGFSVTTRLRTAVDLARFSQHFDEGEDQATRRLIADGGFTVDELVDELNRRRNLPNKRLATDRVLGLTRASIRC